MTSGTQPGTFGSTTKDEAMNTTGSSVTQHQAMSLCSSLAGAELTHPFGDSSVIFKVSGRIFAAISGDDPSSLITLKCDPGYAASLVSEYDDIKPGYHMNKRHWISAPLGRPVDPSGRPVPGGLLRELIRESYDLVVAALPARERDRLGAG
jgi:predicted DNA-binding protein (MmcQ/YjbR family)